MGCDIHSMMEVRIDGAWFTATAFAEESDGDISAMDEPIKGRSYTLFSILANVRNGHGFAGCDTGDELVPIAMPRGVPEDASVEFKKWSEQWDLDGHSHTYHTLADLLAYDFHRQAVVRGVLSLDEYSHWAGWGMGQGREPRGWCGGISGPKIRIVEPSAANDILSDFGTAIERATTEKQIAIKASKVYVNCEWRAQYVGKCAELWLGAIPAMFKEVRERKLTHDDVRLCMFFDN